MRIAALRAWLRPAIGFAARILRVPARLLIRLTPPAIRRTFFGSDVFDRYTAEYSWCANQLGHVALGILANAAAIAAALVWRETGAWLGYESATRLATGAAITGAVALLLFAVYVTKEVADAMMEAPSIPGAAGQFVPSQLEIDSDSLADCFFVLAGILAGMVATAWLLASVTPDGRAWRGALFWTGLVGSVVLGAIAATFIRHFVPQKRRFDRAGLPYFFRLSRFTGRVEVCDPTGCRRDAQAAAAIRGFLQRPAGHRWALVTGPAGSGRTTFAVAMACEAAIAGRQPRYLRPADLPDTAGTGGAADDLEPAGSAALVVLDECDGSSATCAALLNAVAASAAIVLVCDESHAAAAGAMATANLGSAGLIIRIVAPLETRRRAGGV